MLKKLIYKFLKPYIEKLELEFEQKKLRDLKTYYDISLRVKNLEEFKRYVTDTLTTSDYKVDLSEYSSIDLKSELGLLFQTSKNKPVRILIRGIKKIKKGFKYPGLLTLSIIITTIFFISLILNYLNYIKGDFFINLLIFIFSLLITIVLLLQREVVKLYIYVKAIGIFDIENNISDLRVILAGNSDKKKEEYLDILKEDISQIYSIISRKFTKIGNENLSREFLDELSKILEDLESKKAKLEVKFLKGEIKYDEYIKEKEKIEKEIERYRKIIDIL